MAAKPKRPARRVVVPVVVLAIAAAVTLLFLRERRPEEIVLSGTLEARTVNVGSLVGGRVTKTLVDEGSHVAVGQVLVTLETETIDRQIAEQRAETDVQSTVAGVVQSFPLRPGDIVAPDQTVAEILEESQLWVRVYVPETELKLTHVNQPVRVRVDTFPNQWFRGHIASISSQGEYTPRNIQTRAQRIEQVFGVKILVDPDPGLHAGMAAEVDLGVKGHRP